MASHIYTQSKNFFLSILQSISSFGDTKIHDFRRYQQDFDYSVDFVNSYNYAHLTTGINVQAGERIILSDREQTLEYCAEAVDYYRDGYGMRTIKLKRTSC